MKDFVSVGNEDTRHELVIAIGSELVSNQLFLVGQLAFQVERVLVVEWRLKTKNYQSSDRLNSLGLSKVRKLTCRGKSSGNVLRQRSEIFTN